MEAKKFTIIIIIAASLCQSVVFGQAGRSLSSPVSTNPIGPGNVPVTTYQSGLHRTPNPIDNTANLIATGHIGGGKHFRGVLPYNAISDFGGSIEENSVDSFLRYSSISSNYYKGGLTPYYSYTSTVTHTVPGTNMVITPPTSKIRGAGLGTSQQMIADTYLQNSAIGGSAGSFGKARFFPVGTMPTEKVISEQDDSLPSQLSEKYQQQRQQFDIQLQGVRSKAEKLQKQLVSGETGPNTQLQDYTQPFEIRDKDEKTDSQTQTGQTQQPQSPERLDVYETMMQEYKQLNESYEQLFGKTIEQRQQQVQAENDSAWQSPDISERKLKYQQSPRITESPAEPAKSQSGAERTTETASAEARGVLSQHDTFASYSQDKFNQSLRAAEQYMKQGKFYLACDAYTLAAMYKPNDPLAYVGKSHSLFAAGEYISSALYMAKAIEIFPAYADFRIDIVSMIGSVDTVEKRIADINRLLETSKSPELQFLLAYVYMQLDRLQKAKETIEPAYGLMPEVPAVSTLRTAIQKRMAK